jgi:hypothetical protein
MNKKLKLEFLKDVNNFNNLVSLILNELIIIDKNAKQLPLNLSLASQNLTGKLWKFAPEEYGAYKFRNIKQQTEEGKELLPTKNFNENVTIHFGWNTLSFDTSLNAAWFSWIKFCQSNTDTFNCCLYPKNLDWYVLRAGTNLYPMKLIKDKYELVSSD